MYWTTKVPTYILPYRLLRNKKTSLHHVRCQTTIPTASEQIISTIKSISNVKPNHQYKDAQTATIALSSLQQIPGNAPKTFKFTGELQLQPVAEDLNAKLNVYGVANDIYIQESHKLGQQVIKYLPLAFRVFYNPQVPSYLDEKLINDIQKCPVPQESRQLFRQLGIKQKLTVQNVIGLNFIQDPQKCLQSLLNSIGTENGDKLVYPGRLGNVLGKFKEMSVLKTNPQYVFHEGNQFTLPALRDSHPAVNMMLLNSSISKKLIKNPSLSKYLDLLSSHGNALYKLLVKSSILRSSYGENMGQFYLLTQDSYCQFLLDSIGVYEKLINIKPFEQQLINSNAADLYYRQFGQYLSILSMNQLDTLIKWCQDHVATYNEIFESLNHRDIKQFMKDFSASLQNDLSYIDTRRLVAMEENLQGVQVPAHSQLNIDPQVSTSLAKDYISYTTYRLGVYHRFSIANRNQMLVMKAFGNNTALLQELGEYLMAANTEAGTFIRDFVSFLLNVHLQPLKLDKLVAGSPRFNKQVCISEQQTPDVAALFDLASINYHVSMVYLKKKGGGTKSGDILKNLSRMGRSFYRYNVHLEAETNGLAGQYTSLFTSKTFKTFVYQNLDLPSSEDKLYTELLDDRAVTSYLKLKVGSDGFDQLVGAIALTTGFEDATNSINDSDHLTKWLRGCTKSETLETIPNILAPQKVSGSEVLSSPQPESGSITKLESFDASLQEFYTTLT